MKMSEKHTVFIEDKKTTKNTSEFLEEVRVAKHEYRIEHNVLPNYIVVNPHYRRALEMPYYPDPERPYVQQELFVYNNYFSRVLFMGMEMIASPKIEFGKFELF